MRAATAATMLLPMMLLHKGLLLVAAGGAALGLIGPNLSTSSPPPVEFTGTLIGWSANRLGDVAIELRGNVPDRQDPLELWFVAAADKTETVRFEQVMIEIALRHAESGQPLTVVTEGSTEGHGRSLKDAIKLASVRWESR